MRKSFYRLLICSMPLMLTACGDGWEAQRTTEVFPYGNARTAGSGVVYVRTKMMPEKELVVEPQSEVKAEAPAPAINADKVFNDSQMKGGASAKPVETSPAAEPAKEEVKPEDAKKHSSIEQSGSEIKKAAVETGKEAASVAPSAGGVIMAEPPLTKAVEGAKLESGMSGKSSAADVISSPKQDKIQAKFASGSGLNVGAGSSQRHPQETEVSVSGLKADQRGIVPPPPSAGLKPYVMQNQANTQQAVKNVETVHSVAVPGNEIVTPKMDYVRSGSNEGQKSLDQIYENPF